MTGRCTGGQHHAPTSGGACPCGAVTRHPAAVTVRAVDEGIVAALTEMLSWLGYPHDPQLIAGLRRIAEQRAAAELLAAADEIPRYSLEITPRDWLRARAAALTGQVEQ